MDHLKQLSRIYSSSKALAFDDNSRIVLLSDCHRGDGGRADTFFRNRNLYLAAMQYYFAERYTYIELGDGDELWENKNLSAIIDAHPEVFELLSRFCSDGRFYSLVGNHDIERKSRRQPLDHGTASRQKSLVSVFENLRVYDGIRLVYTVTGDEMFLVHGHQVDFFNSTLWWLARFMVRHLWRPLESFGVNDPTSAAKNYHKKAATERKLTQWVTQYRRMLIAGHTHRPAFPDADKPPYFNDGSCVHPGCITAIEITGGTIALVKWCVKVRADGVLYVGKDKIAGPAPLADYFCATFPKA
jgi:UDP-2,3-diacylglucosamine pyrophosphatase LpxH